MAVHNLKIVVVDGGKSGNFMQKNATSNKESNEEDYKNSKLYKLLNAKKIIKDKIKTKVSPTTMFAMDLGLKLGSQIIKQTANYYLSDIGRRNGDSNYQAYIERQIEIITDPLSVLGGVLSGATIGSMMGPLGIAVGAIAGAISSSVSLSFKYANRERSYQHELFKENNSQVYALARTSFQGFTGRLR